MTTGNAPCCCIGCRTFELGKCTAARPGERRAARRQLCRRGPRQAQTTALLSCPSAAAVPAGAPAGPACGRGGAFHTRRSSAARPHCRQPAGRGRLGAGGRSHGPHAVGCGCAAGQGLWPGTCGVLHAFRCVKPSIVCTTDCQRCARRSQEHCTSLAVPGCWHGLHHQSTAHHITSPPGAPPPHPDPRSAPGSPAGRPGSAACDPGHL